MGLTTGKTEMKNYTITDRLNPNAVSEDAADCKVDKPVMEFTASSDAEALAAFDRAIESGLAGYSEGNTRRVNPKLWRTKRFYLGGNPLWQI